MLILAVPSSSQVSFQGNTRSLNAAQRSTLENSFLAYRAFEMNLPQMNDFVKSQGTGEAVFNLQIGEDYNWQLKLVEHEIRSNNYLAMIETSEGRVVRKRGVCNTYKGFVDGDSALTARLFISDNNLHGYINSGNGIVIIEPLSNYVEEDGTGSRDFIAYKKEDAKFDPIACYTSVGSGNGTGTPVEFREDCEHPECNVYDPPFPTKERYIELATEADCAFFNEFADVGVLPEDQAEAALEHIESLVNMVDGLYTEAANVHVILVFQHLWAGCPPAPEPYPYVGTGMATHWDAVRNWWNTNLNYIHRDHVHLFSGKDLLPGNGIADGYSGVVTSLDAMCGRDYNIVTDPLPPYWYESYTVSDRAHVTGIRTIAHELGHTFGLSHLCDCHLMHSNCPDTNCPSTSDCFSLGLNNSHHQLCRGLNEYNYFYDRPRDVCLEFPPPLDYEFNMLVESGNAILLEGDAICAGQILTCTFYNTFDNYVTWFTGIGLSLIGNPNTPQIQVQATGTGPLASYIGVTFNYNGQQVSYYQTVHIGEPLPVGPPIISSSYIGGLVKYSVGFPMPPGADFIQYSYQVTNTSVPYSDYGTTTNANPLITYIPAGACVTVEVFGGNECGINENPPYSPFYICFGSGNPLITPPGDSDMQVASQHAASAPLLEKKLAPNSANVADKKGFRIFPNPAGDRFFVSLENPSISVVAKVYDLNGRLIFHQIFAGEQETIEINTSLWQSGLYTLKLVRSEEMLAAKIIIQH